MKQSATIFFILLITGISSSSWASNCYPFPNQGTHPNQGHQVQSYQSHFLQCNVEGRQVLSIRSFRLNGMDTQLVVDPQSMFSEIVFAECAQSCTDLEDRVFLKSYYGQLLAQAGSAPFPLQNDGIMKGRGRKTAITIDMCPSSKGFSQDVYNALISKANSTGRSVPVGVAMTRGWLNRWSNQFNQLKSYQARGILSIQWINHSSTHPDRHGVPLAQNFLLSARVDIVDEVLGNEEAMIGAGITPSSFFRFPGLVSDRATIDYVTNQGLITLGSDAWLAKNETPTEGSIILIHGNRNEPVGERQFLNYLRTMDSQGHQFGHLAEVL